MSIYKTLSNIERDGKNYQQALNYHEQYSKALSNIITDNKNIGIIEAEQKYMLSVVESEISQLSIKHLEIQRLLIMTLLLIAILIVIHYRIVLYKNRQLSTANEEVLQLTEIANNFKDTKESVRENHIHQFNIIKRATALETLIQGTSNKQGKVLIKKFNERVYGRETIDWNVLYKIINQAHHGVFDIIKKTYPLLDEIEFKIACLNYSKFAVQEIAIIMELSIYTIHARTSSIRRKLGIKKYGSLTEFINEKLNLEDEIMF